MKKIETQIRHLKKEIKSINEEFDNEIDRIKLYEKDIHKKKYIVKEKREEIYPKFNQYVKVDKELKDLYEIDGNYKEYNIHERTSAIYYNNEEMLKIMNTNIDQIKKRIIVLEGEKKIIQKDINEDFSFDIFSSVEEFNRKEKIAKRLSLFEKLRIMFGREYSAVSSHGIGLYETFDEVESEREKRLKPKYKTLNKLEKRLAKQKKQRSLANAYLKKNRLDASTVKTKLKVNKICPYCGEMADDFETDHIYPVSSGGLSVAENMVNVCKPCNRNKGNLTLRQFIKKFDLGRDNIEMRLDELGKKF